MIFANNAIFMWTYCRMDMQRYIFWTLWLSTNCFLCINNKLRIFFIWNYTFNTWGSFLYLGFTDDTFLVQSSVFITNHIIFLYFSVDQFWKYFCNGLSFISRLPLLCDLPQTAHWYAFGISENTYGHFLTFKHIKLIHVCCLHDIYKIKQYFNLLQCWHSLRL